MTETKWLLEADPKPMLEYILSRRTIHTKSEYGDKAIGAATRQFRLFMAASCRKMSSLLPDKMFMGYIEKCEDWADKGVDSRTANELSRKARMQTSSFIRKAMASNDPGGVNYAIALTLSILSSDPLITAGAWPSDPVFGPRQSAIIRTIFGNVFRPMAMAVDGQHRWVIYHGGHPGSKFTLSDTALSVARKAYDERDANGVLIRANLLVLSDALEDGGCTDEALLMPLRGYNPCFGTAGDYHKQTCVCRGTRWLEACGDDYMELPVRGFRVLDMILGY